jgi:hypothetical protein
VVFFFCVKKAGLDPQRTPSDSEEKCAGTRTAVSGGGPETGSTMLTGGGRVLSLLYKTLFRLLFKWCFFASGGKADLQRRNLLDTDSAFKALREEYLCIKK